MIQFDAGSAIPTDLGFLFPYLAIFVAAIVEGEFVFLGACVLVKLGQLNPAGVFVAGALGGAVGDQAYFYLFRGRLRHSLSRFDFWRRNRDRLDRLVQSCESAIIVASRFLPGFRIALQAACAHAGVSPLKFSTLNLLASFAWAGILLFVVSYFGPQALQHLGLTAWWAPLLSAVAVLVLLQVARIASRKRLSTGSLPNT
jgi:membrane protein DedA with SNARE-associated domain